MTQIIAEDLQHVNKHPLAAGCSFLIAIFFCLLPFFLFGFGFLGGFSMKKILFILTVPVFACIFFFWFEILNYGYKSNGK